MRVLRLDVDGRLAYGLWSSGDRVELLDGDPIAGSVAVRTGETVPLLGAALRVPCEPGTIFAIGRNYAGHAREMGFTLPPDPSVFIKARGSLLDPEGVVVLPPPSVSAEVEHEAELAVVIGRTARNVPAAHALDYVFGYTCADDVSARDLQRSDVHVTRAKGYDTFCPLGPWIETEFDPAAARIRCSVNGRSRQDGSTADLIFDVPAVISFLSTWATLRPGDVILTGSPEGTGRLADGDEVEIEIAGIGTLRHGVAAASPTRLSDQP
jgi:2-keto-4-pentenoate hydratase/2-oxohepta-3-ene-1,7-dioic acid hydratase in catechol pathway